MDLGFRSSVAPRIEVGSIFRSRKELRAAASKRFLENGRGWLHSWKRHWPPESLFLRRPPRGEKGEKNKTGCPFLDPSMY